MVVRTLRRAVFAMLKPIILLKQTVKAVAMTSGIQFPILEEKSAEAR